MATRINKYLSEVGYCSRRVADNLIEEGKVTINGEIPKKGTKVEEGDQVEVEGQRIEKSMKHPSIKVVMQRSSSRNIETDKFKTTTIDIEHFWFMCRHLLWKNDLLTLKINEVSALRVSQ